MGTPMYHALAPYYDHIYPHEEFAAAFLDALPAIREHLGQQDQFRVLDLCCGTGRALSLFAGQSGAKLYGVDADKTMLEAAENNFGWKNPRPEFRRKDVRHL